MITFWALVWVVWMNKVLIYILKLGSNSHLTNWFTHHQPTMTLNNIIELLDEWKRWAISPQQYINYHQYHTTNKEWWALDRHCRQVSCGSDEVFSSFPRELCGIVFKTWVSVLLSIRILVPRSFYLALPDSESELLSELEEPELELEPELLDEPLPLLELLSLSLEGRVSPPTTSTTGLSTRTSGNQTDITS